MEAGLQFGNLKRTIVSTLKCHIRNISHLFISIEFKYSKLLRTTIFNYGLMVLEVVDKLNIIYVLEIPDGILFMNEYRDVA